MRVHIACIDDNHIVPRMSRWLADAHGWTIGPNADNSADVNLYMPYTMLAPLGMARTPTAAWFTHHEPDTGKAAIWQRAARDMSLRLVTSRLYLDGLSAHGPTLRVQPGIDRERFTPRGKRHGKGLIGVAGIGSARKGTELVRRLVSDGYDVTAAGRGWGIPERMVDYDDMPALYSSLDVYLCTATIEGIPAPPLEALACGAKVVVPSGVGIMDELPEMTGIRHYEAGNYADMKRALEMALADDTYGDILRDVTAPYSKRAWCDSFQAALETMLEGAPV